MSMRSVLLAFTYAAASGATLLGPNAQAGSLGRLFFTPEQRAQLEQSHIQNRAAGKRAAELGKKERLGGGGKEGEISILTINGIVQKHGGPRTVWINGVAQNADNSKERAPESQAIAIPGEAQPARLKVGQKLLLEKPTQAKPPPGKQEGQKPVGADNNDD